MWKLEFWKLEIKFGNWNFEELFKNGSFKKLNLRIWISKNYLRMEVWKLDLRKWNFEELFEMEFLKLNLKIGALKIKFKNWSFEN